MPKELHDKLVKQGKKKGLSGKDLDAYVYGTMRKTGWKPNESFEGILEKIENIFESSNDIAIELSDSIMKFQENHNYDDYYKSGGCYIFAYALGLVLKDLNQSFDYMVMGDGLHYAIEFDGEYWDVNGSSSSIDDISSNIYTNDDEDRTWKAANTNK